MAESYLTLLEDVKNDRRSGAWVIARKTVRCLDALAKEKASGDLQELAGEVKRAAAEILKSQPGMAQLVHFFNAIFTMIEEGTGTDTLSVSRKISGEAKRFEELSKNAVAKVAEYGSELVEEDSLVLIHSNSSTILEILKKTLEKGRIFQVMLSESRPIGEGRACAEELAKLGIQSTYYVDAAISKGVECADVVLLGADSLSETTLINKVGSRAICLLAREAVVPCYAACESSKFIPAKLSPKKEPPRDPSEVWDSPPDETTIENYYFDEVALDLFDGIITEEGVLTPEEIGGRIRSQKLSRKLIKMLK